MKKEREIGYKPYGYMAIIYSCYLIAIRFSRAASVMQP